MVFFFSGVWCNPKCPEYGLEASDMQRVAAGLVQRPLTFEHAGIIQAVESAYLQEGGSIVPKAVEAELDAASDALHRPVGRVVAADRNGRFIGTIDEAAFPNTVASIKSGRLSVSLTHADTPAGPKPLELSLVHDPARETARVLGSYKGDQLPLPIAAHLLTMATDTPTPVPEVSPVEAALAMIPDEGARSAVEKQLTNYNQSLEQNEQRYKELEAALEAEKARVASFEKNAETDGKVLQQMIDNAIRLAQECDPEACNAYGTPDAAAFSGLSPEQSMAARQLVHACSKAMATAPAPAAPVPVVADESPAKRSRGSGRDALMKALQRRFND